MKQQIMELARTLGHVSETDEERLEALCQAAETEVKGWLRAGTGAQECESAFVLAAAWVALAGLAVSDSGGVEQFTAGDVSVKTGAGDGKQRSVALRLQARQVLRGYLRDESFDFRGVRG